MFLKAGAYRFRGYVYHPTGLPCLRITGEEFYTDSRFSVGNHGCALCTAAEIACDDMTPNTWRLPLREIQPKTVVDYEQGGVRTEPELKVYFFPNNFKTLDELRALESAE